MPFDNASGTGKVSSTVKAKATGVIGTAKMPMSIMRINSSGKILEGKVKK